MREPDCKFLSLVFLIFYWSPCYIFSQNQTVLFEKIGGREGFRPTYANDFVQDSSGLIWISSSNGLYLHDGVSFKSHRSVFGSPDSLSGNFLTRLALDSDGSLWVGTYSGGVNRLDPTTGVFKRYPLDIDESSGEVLSILVSSENNVWVATALGLFYFHRDQDRFELFDRITNSDQKSVSPLVFSTIQRNDGLIWLGTRRGLYYLEEKGAGLSGWDIGLVPNSEVLESLQIKSFYEDSAGFLWIGTNRGLYIYQDSKKLFSKAVEIFPHFEVSKSLVAQVFQEDSVGDLWIGSSEGLYRFDRSRGVFLSYHADRFVDHSLSNSDVGALMLDSSGVLWIGTYGGGISKYSPARQMFNLVSSYPHIPNSLAHRNVTSISEGRRGMVWIGCNNSINLLDPKTGRIFRNALRGNKNLPDFVTVQSVVEDVQNDLWIGSTGAGVVHYDDGDKTFSAVPFTGLVESKSYYANRLLLDRNHRLWIPTSDGLILKESGEDNSFKRVGLERFRSTDASGRVAAYRVFLDQSGRLWVGTLSEGLFYQTEPEELVFRQLPVVSEPGQGVGISSAVVVAFGEKREGEIWVGTYGGGINRLVFDDEGRDVVKVEYITEKNGLPDNNVCDILPGEEDDLWVSSGSGIAKFNTVEHSFVRFDSRDGLQGEDFTAGVGLRSSEGVLYFGGDFGLNYFRPEEVAVSNYEPRVVLTDVLVFNESISKNNEVINLDGSIEFDHHQSVISFQFAAMDFNIPSKLKYQYKMSKYSDEWLPVNDNRMVTFTELAPGSYQLRVRATNHHGVWSRNELVLRIISRPPFYRTWWAYSFYVVFVLSSASALIKRRERNYKLQILKREQELLNEKLVADRLKRVDKIKDEILANTSHELRTPLNGMIGLAKSMLDGVTGKLTFDQRDNLLMIVSSGIRLNNLVNDILDFSKMVTRQLELNLTSQDVYASVSMVLNLSKHLLGDKDVELVNEIASDCPYVLADNDRLQQILYNLVGNAIKFTERGSIRVGARVEGDFLWIDVRDTGIGIEAGQFERIFQSFEQGDGSTSRKFGGTGLGLAVTKQLIELQNGEIQVESQVGMGSCFSVKFPISSVPLSEHTLPGLETVSKVTNYDALLEEEAMMRSRDFEAEITGDGMFKILVVDDNPVNQRVLVNRLVLERKFTIFKASSGAEALDIIFSEIPPDLVLLDIMMPEQSGYQVCKKVREVYSPDELPILLVTAKNQVGDLVEGFDAGANDFLTKPISQEELISRVGVHLKMLELHRELIASNEKLVEINRNLDLMVKDRTRELELSNVELQTLDQIVQVINQETDLPSLLATILRQGFQIFPQAQRTKFWLREGDGDNYRPVAWAGKDTQKVPSLTLHFDELNERYVREENHAHDDVYITSNTKLREVPERMRDLPLSKSSMSLVMVIDGKKQGFLIFENDHDDKAFNEMDARKLFRLRGHVLSALDKARTLQELQLKNDAIIRAQNQMVTQAKLASLGALTAGIAHEIRNPLNFINNFSELSISLAEELKEGLKQHLGQLDEETVRDINDLVLDLEENASRISHHGHRAEDIVQRMLDHSRTGVGEKQLKELNSLVEESVNFGFHGVISRYPQLNVDLERLYDPQVGQVEVMSNDISRVIINMVENSCYALREKKAQLGETFKPRLLVETRHHSDSVDIVIRDNGLGIPKEAMEQIFMPFYTTKPTGDGTGLGLSISYEIVTQGHNGQLFVQSEEGSFTEFTVRLPH